MLYPGMQSKCKWDRGKFQIFEMKKRYELFCDLIWFCSHVDDFMKYVIIITAVTMICTNISFWQRSTLLRYLSIIIQMNDDNYYCPIIIFRIDEPDWMRSFTFMFCRSLDTLNIWWHCMQKHKHTAWLFHGVLFENNARQRINENKTNQTSSLRVFQRSRWRSSNNTSIAVRPLYDRQKFNNTQNYTKNIYFTKRQKQLDEKRRNKMERERERKRMRRGQKRQERLRSKQWPNSLNFVENDIVAYIFLSFNSFVVFISLVFVQDHFRCVRKQTMKEPTMRQQQR